MEVMKYFFLEPFHFKFDKTHQLFKSLSKKDQKVNN